jgi:signal transduction histidine kinase/putative methionine-R-sulfoxide reductase with GAF domain
MSSPSTRDPAARTAPAVVETDVSQGAREARALAEIVHEINQSPELHRVFALIARHATDLLGAAGSRVGMLESGEIMIVGTCGEAGAVVGARIALDDALCAEALRAARPTRRSRTAPHGDASATAPRDVVAAPLLVGHRAIGAITVLGRDARDFSEHDEQILLALANHAAVAIEHARLLRASVRTLRHASILATSARSLALNVSPQAMYADIWRIAHQSLGADGISIFLADAGTRVTELAYTAGVGIDLADQVVPAFWDTFAGRAMQTSTADFRCDLRELADRPISRLLLERGINAVALLPLVVEGRPRGLLSLRFRDIQGFEPEQRQLLTDFSSHAAVALRNALLLERAEQRAARFSAVAKVQQAISGVLSLTEVYAEIYRAVASVVDAPSFTLMRFDEAAQEFIPDYVVDDGRPVDCAALPHFPLSDGVTSQAYRLRAPSVVSRTAQGWTGQTVEIGGTRSPAALLSAPIVHGDRVLGVLQAQSYRHDAYDWGDVDLVTLIARQAGTAIANARLFEAERHEREEAEAAAEIARVALRAVTIEEAAGELLRILHEVAPSDGWALAVEQSTDAGLRIAAARGAAAGLDGTLCPTTGEDPIPGTWDAVLPLVARDHAVGILAVGAAAAGAARRLASITRLLPSLALALHTIRMRDEERRLAEQMRQSEKLAALGELVAGVAHEVNNPLAGISAFAQLLQEDRLAPEQHEAVLMIKREADRAVAVIRDLLTFARKSGPRAVLVDLNSLLEQTLRLRQYGLRTAGVEVVLELDPALQSLHGDDRQLQQVLLNLIVNAEHAMASMNRRVLGLRTANDGTRVQLEVTDSGIGMSPELQARIFEPFFTTKGEGKGTGLGLSVSYGIIHTHGGTLHVESAPGMGSTFRITLPADRRTRPLSSPLA